MDARTYNERRRRYCQMLDTLDKKNDESLTKREINYYIDVMTANVNNQAEMISNLQKDLEQTKTKLAMYKQYLRKLKALS